MRKEIIGICFFFLVILTLISLVSYSPLDPSVNHATHPGEVHNVFGFFGAHIAGILIGLFGLGAFVIPVLLLIFSVQFFSQQPNKVMILTLVGGLLLIVSTGSLSSLIALPKHEITVLGTAFSSGGFIGIPLGTFLVRYTNMIGSTIILIVILLIGLILAGFSMMNFVNGIQRTFLFAGDRIMTFYIKYKEKRKKSARFARIKKEQKTKPKTEIKIQNLPPRKIKPAPVPKQEVFDFMRKDSNFQLPSVSLLEDPEPHIITVDDENLKMKSRLLEKKLEDFGVKGEVAAISPGPVITTFEYRPAPGVKINKVVNLTDDLALALRAMSIRIVAPHSRQGCHRDRNSQYGKGNGPVERNHRHAHI